MKPYYSIHPMNIYWCTICGADLKDSEPCSHPSLHPEYLKAQSNRMIADKRRAIALEEYRYGTNKDECYFLPDSVKDLIALKDAQTSLRKNEVKIWFDAFYYQRDATGKIAVQEYYNGVKAVQEQRVYSPNVLYKKYIDK